MRSLIKYCIIGAIALTAGTAAHAQHELQLNLDYNVNVPTGAFKDFVSHPAYKGFTAGLAYPLNDQLSIGLSFGYNDYYQKYPRQVYDDGKGNTISAVLSNSIQQLPLMVTANYALIKEGIVRPYIGAGAGLNFISFDQYLGEFDDPHSMTRFAMKGEAGILISLSNYSSTALKIGGSYNYSPFNTYGVKDLSTWGLQAGIRIPLR